MFALEEHRQMLSWRESLEIWANTISSTKHGGHWAAVQTDDYCYVQSPSKYLKKKENWYVETQTVVMIGQLKLVRRKGSLQI